MAVSEAMGVQCPAGDPWAALVVRAWNLLGGLDWSGLPMVAEMVGADPHELAEGLAVIRARMAEKESR